MRRKLSLLLVLMVFAASLAGCGGTPPATSPAAQTPAAGDSAEPAQSAVAEASAPVDLTALYDPPLTVTYARNAGLDPKFPEGQDYEDNVFTREYLTELGIEAKQAWAAQGLEQYETKLNLYIASGELPDIIQVTNMGQFARLVEAGLVEDLSQVFESLATPLVKQSFQTDDGLALKQVTLDGKLWALPEGPTQLGGLEYTFIREDWRLNLGLPVPQTTEDLIAMANAFATQDPDGNGKDDTYGLVIGNQPYENYMEIRGFANSFGAYPLIWIEKDGELAYGSIQPEMKNALSALARMYADGTIDPEFVAKNAYAASSDAVAGKGGICFGQFWLITWPLPDTNKANADQFWKPYPILNTAAGTANRGSMAQTTVSKAYLVRKGFAHPEALVKMYNTYIDKLYGERFDAEKYHSVDDKSIFMLAPVGGTFGNVNTRQNLEVTKAIDAKDESFLTTEEVRATYRTLMEYVDGNKDTAHLTQWLLFYGKDSVFGIENALTESENYTRNRFYGADTPEMQRRMSILRSQEEAIILDIITGNKPVGAFDEFVANWRNLGGETITFEVNRWFADNK